jgi:hypothetical protein
VAAGKTCAETDLVLAETSMEVAKIPFLGGECFEQEEENHFVHRSFDPGHTGRLYL